VPGGGVLRSPSTPPPYLGVESSVTGRRWQGLTPRQDRLSLQIAQRCGVPAMLARALARRNLKPWDVAAYLDPHPIDPIMAMNDLADLDRATDRLVDAVRGQQNIALVASTGIDGCCALAMMRDALESIAPEAARCTIRHAAKLTGGDPVTDLAADHDLILLLDLGCGNTGSMHTAQPCDIILVDNDASGPVRPAVHAYLNGNRHDDSGHYADLCTAGLTCLLLQATDVRLRMAGLPRPDLSHLTEYVCLAAAAERVSLHANNRPFVLQGLERIRRRTHPGLKALADAIPLRHKVRFHDLGTRFAARMVYGEGPEHQPLTAQLLGAIRDQQAANLAAVLDQFHADGIPATDRFTAEACELAAGRRHARGLVWAASQNWPTNRLEAIAVALQEDFNWPALAIRIDALTATGVAVGVPGFNLGTAIVNCQAAGFAVRGGGHSMKAALTIPLADVSAVVEALGTDLARQNPRHETRRDIRLDGVVLPKAVNFRLVNTIDRAGPFGIGSPRPRFVLTHQQILKRRKYGIESLRIEMSDRSHTHLNGFVSGGYDSELGAFLRHCGHSPVHLAGTISMARHGRGTQFNIEDAAKI